MRPESFTAVKRNTDRARAPAVKVQFRSLWAGRTGTHMTPLDKGAIDAVCIYCREADECSYVRPDAHRASVTATATKGTSRYRAAD